MRMTETDRTRQWEVEREWVLAGLLVAGSGSLPLPQAANVTVAAGSGRSLADGSQLSFAPRTPTPFNRRNLPV